MIFLFTICAGLKLHPDKKLNARLVNLYAPASQHFILNSWNTMNIPLSMKIHQMEYFEKNPSHKETYSFWNMEITEIFKNKASQAILVFFLFMEYF